ncbi:MAG TPA: RNA pyrophosphohydrolase [Terriglobia bacterium]|nr:RNA pyrophosphohydrolase [Terriglobia bacterium]
MKGQYFRAGAGAVIVDHKGRVLALERSAAPGAWQLPQGGMMKDEEPLATVLREVEEETGIHEDDLRIMDQYPEPLTYELPVELRSAKTGRGQAHYWFLFRHRAGAPIALPSPGEFQRWQWMTFEELIERVVPFRKPVYTRLNAWMKERRRRSHPIPLWGGL